MKITGIFIRILLIFICGFCSGCSILELEGRYITEMNNPKFERFSNPSNSYSKEVIQYKNNDILLTIEPSIRGGDCSPISFGPPILPIIPLFCFASEKDFVFNFIIENYGDAITLDTKRIKLINQVGQAVTHDSSNYCSITEGYIFVCRKQKNEILTNITSPIVVNGKVMFSLKWFNAGKPDEHKIIFGDISSANKQIIIPPLTFRKESNMLYCPLIFSGHEPCFR